jgi:hypothetical protein
VKQLWDKQVEAFLQLDLVRRKDTWLPFDVVDGLRNVLQFAGHGALGWSIKTTTWLQSLRGATSDSYYAHALAEQDFRNRRARHIVYGHTHAAETVPLDASYAEGFVLNQTYFNSGTWRRVHRATVSAPQEQEFLPSESLSVLSFFQGDERGGRPYETWTGTLGIGAADAPLYRLDAKNAAASVALPAPASLPVRAPHFTAPQTTVRQPAAR